MCWIEKSKLFCLLPQIFFLPHLFLFLLSHSHSSSFFLPPPSLSTNLLFFHPSFLPRPPLILIHLSSSISPPHLSPLLLPPSFFTLFLSSAPSLILSSLLSSFSPPQPSSLLILLPFSPFSPSHPILLLILFSFSSYSPYPPVGQLRRRPLLFNGVAFDTIAQEQCTCGSGLEVVSHSKSLVWGQLSAPGIRSWEMDFARMLSGTGVSGFGPLGYSAISSFQR